MIFLIKGRSLEDIDKIKRTDRTKTLKNEEKEKRSMLRKSNNNNKHLWFYFLYKKIYFARKHSLKKVVKTLNDTTKIIYT